ncbi:MAG: helix-turn-helix domain-containing protein [Candidatus Micrarchaeia archaeon]
MIELRCKKISKLILPAIRVAVAEELYKRYNYTQDEIAKSLGVVQVAVSKYLNGKYSKGIAKIKEHIQSKGLAGEIVDAIVKKEGKERIDEKISALCENEELYSLV